MNNLTINQKINILCNANTFFYSDDLENIINKYNISYTKNNNGIFLNVSLLDNNIVNQLYQLFINSENINNYHINDNFLNETLNLLNSNTTDNTSTTDLITKKINIKHSKLDYFILKTLNDNLNLI